MTAPRDDATTVGRTTDVAWGRLVRLAFGTLLRHATTADSSPLAVVLVSDGDLSLLLGDLRSAWIAADRGTDRAGRVGWFTGPDLGRALGAGDARAARSCRSVGLVVVDRIDRVGSAARQRAAAAFLDDLGGRGVSTCVTVGRGPGCGPLVPRLQSRLTAGLVVHVPAPPPAAMPAHRARGSLRRIVRTTAERYGLQPADVTGASRSRSTVEVRNLAMYLARVLIGGSFGSIGGAFGGRDHTTVMRGIRTVESRIAADAGFARDVDDLIAHASGRVPAARRRPRNRRRSAAS